MQVYKILIIMATLLLHLFRYTQKEWFTKSVLTFFKFIFKYNI